MLRWALGAGICPWDRNVSQERCGAGGHLWACWLPKGSAPKVCWSLEWDGDRAEASTSQPWHSSVIDFHPGSAEVPEKSRMP